MAILIGTPHSHGAGYLLADDRASGGKKLESDIDTCRHCQCTIDLQKHREDGAFCSKCMGVVCLNCGSRMLTYGCENFLRQLEQSIETRYRYEQFRKLAGL